ncbi:response regulator [Paenibacillus sp. TRM 82003]|nr:response regulator [Paenibacillus sp. TRM 82003]
MYKAMLVDDDYPVLELLSEAIDWERLGLTLVGGYENGVAALEAAERSMPDVLVTDIGMPKMDGLELVRRLKSVKPNLRVVILSCHSEFDFAKRAMQLQVQDYIVKDTLDPEDLVPVLERFVDGLKEERLLNIEHHQLRHMVDRSREAMREKWVHGAMEQPILQAEAWRKELETFGLPVEGRVILPVIGFLDDLGTARGRFISDDILRFAVTNVFDEVLRDTSAEAVLFPYDTKLWFSLHSFRPTLSVNGYDETRRVLEKAQDALRRTLKVTMSFVFGEQGSGCETVKQGMKGLMANTGQRFYMERGEIAPNRLLPVPTTDLFSLYDEALETFREAVARGDADGIRAKVSEWTNFLRSKTFPPEIVKDWTMKLMLDIRLKHQSIHNFRGFHSAESIHKDIVDIGSLLELKDWLNRQLLSAASAAKASGGKAQRKEVLDAFDYVAKRLDQRIGLEEVAEHLHLNASYFSRLFKKETGETFIEYVIRTKMERAKELLDQTAYSVVKICELLGYDNQSYFIKLFKGYTGATPIDYRNRGAHAES